MIYDTIIIGAGAAGCSAAIYATRFNLKTLMLGGLMPGGLITEALEVENYPGYLSISGQELATNFLNHATELGAEYKVETAESIDKEGEIFKVRTGSGVYEAKTVIITMGTHHRKLGVPGEEEFAGKGVSYCATCDGPFFKDKVVAVVGGGNSAVEGAQDISQHARKVYIIYRSELRAAPLYAQSLQKNDKVVEIAGANVIEIKGGEKNGLVTHAILDTEFEGSKELKLDGVFVQIGYIPRNDIAKQMGLALTGNGYVSVDQGMGTSLSGVFCAGDLNNASNQLHQQVTSAAEGSIAAQSAYRYISGLDHVVKEG